MVIYAYPIHYSRQNVVLDRISYHKVEPRENTKTGLVTAPSVRWRKKDPDTYKGLEAESTKRLHTCLSSLDHKLPFQADLNSFAHNQSHAI